MDDEYTIVEVTDETPARSSGDGLPRHAAPVEEDEDTEEEVEEQNGPWQELDALKRQMKMLETGYKADISFNVETSTFRCHKNIICASSPKFAKMLRKKTRTLQLQDVSARNFRFMLQIIYGGEAKGLKNVDDVLGVARASHEFQVYTAVAYCTKILRGLVNPTTACQILEFAHLTTDTDLKESCTKVLREKTDAVLESDDFIKCTLATLVLILSQEVVNAVTELDLFLACARWAKTRENPRQSLGSALHLIRFRVLTSAEFTKTVIPTELLTSKEERSLMLYFLTGKGEMPEGFSKENNKRKLFMREDEPTVRKVLLAEEEEIKLNYIDNSAKYFTSEEFSACPPLRFSVNTDMNLMGVKVYAARWDKMEGEKYTDDVTVTLKHSNGTVIASATFHGEVKECTCFNVRFLQPVSIHADVTYALYCTYNVPGVRHVFCQRPQKTYKTKTNQEIRVLDTVYSPINHLIIASNIQ